MIRVFETKYFLRWAEENSVSEGVLTASVLELEEGLYEACLGGGIYKKRIPLQGVGKRGGARTIVALKKGNIAIFLYGYAKNQRATITEKEEKALKMLAKHYFSWSEKELSVALKTGELVEVKL